MVTQPPDKSGNHRHCNSGDIIFIICHVTSLIIYLKVYVNVLVEDPNRKSPL